MTMASDGATVEGEGEAEAEAAERHPLQERAAWAARGRCHRSWAGRVGLFVAKLCATWGQGTVLLKTCFFFFCAMVDEMLPLRLLSDVDTDTTHTKTTSIVAPWF